MVVLTLIRIKVLVLRKVLQFETTIFLQYLRYIYLHYLCVFYRQNVRVKHKIQQ
jgi:hypothetical protein